MRRSIIVAAAVALLAGMGLVAEAQGSKVKKHKREDMPKGPPWRLSYKQARWEAMRSGKPIFLFVTKTY